MAVVASLSKYRKTNYIIFTVILLIAALWFGYDGYYNQGFIEKNTDENGQPNSTLKFNRLSPPFLLGGIVLIGIWYAIVRGNNVVADDNELVINSKIKIPYESIQHVDKTHFEKKGFFIIRYKNDQGQEIDKAFSDRKYDNLGQILELIISKIS